MIIIIYTRIYPNQFKGGIPPINQSKELKKIGCKNTKGCIEDEFVLSFSQPILLRDENILFFPKYYILAFCRLAYNS